MKAAPQQRQVEARGTTQRTAVVAACVGNFIEYYDFVIYGYYAALIAALFFPTEDPTVSLLLTFSAFALSYIARPVGALVFGFIGDKYGRKAPLTIAILLIAVCTTLIGLLPTYASWGVAAPIVLTLARLVQGISVGGEYGGALAFIAEYSPDEKRGKYTGWQTFTIGLALLIGAGMASLLTAVLAPDAMQSWGWRLPFLVGLPLGLVGLYIRLKLEETPSFRALQADMEVVKSPLRIELRTSWRSLLISMGIMVIPSLCIYIYFIYLPTYLNAELSYSTGDAQIVNLISLVVYCSLVPVFASLADVVGRRPLLIIGAISVGVVTYPGFALLGQGSLLLSTLALCLLAVAFAPISAASLAAVAEGFNTGFRYTGVSLSLQIPVTVLGGTAPLIATALIAGTGNVHSPALMVVVGAAVSLVAAIAYKETRGANLSEMK